MVPQRAIPLLLATFCWGCAATGGSDQPLAAGPILTAEAKAPQTAQSAPPALRLQDDPEGQDPTWPSASANEAGLSEQVLGQIIDTAAKTETSSLLVLRDGKRVVELYFDKQRRPIETMSMTKSIVSLGIGILRDQGKIESLDVPLSRYYPEFAKGKKASITLRHVLTHTSGIAHGQGAGELNKQKDRLAYARSREVISEPGKVFSYNNEATQLLSGIVEQAAGKSIDKVLDESLFAPLGIREVRWAKDEAGNVQTFYGLAMNAPDLGKLGQLMLDSGRHNGHQLLSSAWIEASSSPQGASDGHGLLWWLRHRQGRVVVSAESLARLGPAFSGLDALRPLQGKSFRMTPQREEFWLEVGAHLEPAARSELARLVASGLQPYDQQPGERFGFAADGWLGQQLIVLPKERIVVVRQHEIPEGRMPTNADNQRVGYFQLVQDVERAVLSR